jgi:hypothetical protein
MTRGATGPGGKSAAFALVDNESKPEPLSRALKAACQTKGLAFREMAAPTRWLVVAAPAEALDALVLAQVKWAAKGLALRAAEILKTHDPQGCIAVSRAALSLDPKSADAHSVLVGPLWSLAYLKQPHDSFDPAIAEIKAALEPDASYPLSEETALNLRGHMGFLLLQTPGREAEAARILDPVAKREDLGREHWNHLYNLACARARLGELDAAFAALVPVIEQVDKGGTFGVDGWREESDFERMHADPRWNALLERHPAPPPKEPDK